MGMLSAAGLVIIGCFQVNEASDIHFSGAVLCFILGGFYFIITTLVTCALKNKDNYFHHIFRFDPQTGSFCNFVMIPCRKLAHFYFFFITFR